MNNIVFLGISFFFKGTVGNDTRSSGGKDAVTLIIMHCCSQQIVDDSNNLKGSWIFQEAFWEMGL